MLLGAGEAEGFAMDHLRSFLRADSGHGNATLTVNERFEMASPVTATSSPAYQVVQQAILETLAHDRVSTSACHTALWSARLLLYTLVSLMPGSEECNMCIAEALLVVSRMCSACGCLSATPRLRPYWGGLQILFSKAACMHWH